MMTKVTDWQEYANKNPETLYHMVKDRVLSDEDLSLAAQHLGGAIITREKLFAALVPLLKDKNPIVVRGALHGIGDKATREIAPAILRVMSDGPTERTQRHALNILVASFDKNNKTPLWQEKMKIQNSFEVRFLDSIFGIGTSRKKIADKALKWLEWHPELFDVTIGELRCMPNWRATIGIGARQTYIRSGRPMACRECGYDKHVDICHIEQVSDFEDSAKIGLINARDNLVALCKTHHWEFDHPEKDEDDEDEDLEYIDRCNVWLRPEPYEVWGYSSKSCARS